MDDERKENLMEQRTWKTSYQYAENESACKEEYRTLLNEAKSAQNGSHAPYSRFHVGAALLLEDGQVIHGSNQENASFPLGLCAERTAISAKASIAPSKKVTAIAIKVNSELKAITQPAAPCGICRQVLLELESIQNSDIQLILQGESGPVLMFNSVKDLMPFYFGASDF